VKFPRAKVAEKYLNSAIGSEKKQMDHDYIEHISIQFAERDAAFTYSSSVCPWVGKILH
jgi:hypothetical protein